jgi:hypothetical protein
MWNLAINMLDSSEMSQCRMAVAIGIHNVEILMLVTVISNLPRINKSILSAGKCF